MNKSYKLSVFYVAVVLLTAVFFPTQIFADETRPLWQQADESRVPKRGSRTTILEKYLVFRLDQNALQATLTVTNTNDSGAGSLRDQVTNAAAGDTIVFDSTVFASAQTINLTSAFFSKQQIDSK